MICAVLWMAQYECQWQMRSRQLQLYMVTKDIEQQNNIYQEHVSALSGTFSLANDKNKCVQSGTGLHTAVHKTC